MMDWQWFEVLATPGLLVVLIGLGFKMFGKIDSVRQELDGKIDAVRQEVRQGINRLDANINRVAEGLARLQGPFQGVDTTK